MNKIYCDLRKAYDRVLNDNAPICRRGVSIGRRAYNESNTPFIVALLAYKRNRKRTCYV